MTIFGVCDLNHYAIQPPEDKKIPMIFPITHSCAANLSKSERKSQQAWSVTAESVSHFKTMYFAHKIRVLQ